MLKVFVVSERSWCLLRIISECAAEGRYTPTGRELAAMLKAARHKPYARTGATRTYDVVGYEIRQLVDAGLLLVIGEKSYRIFEIVETGQRTKRREAVRPGLTPAMIEASQRVVNANADWPRPTAESRTAYDAAMKLGAPVRIVGRPDAQRPMPRVVSPHLEVRSLVGNGSEMVAMP